MTERPLGRDGFIWEVSRITGTSNTRAAEGKTKKGSQQIVSVPIIGFADGNAIEAFAFTLAPVRRSPNRMMLTSICRCGGVQRALASPWNGKRIAAVVGVPRT